MFERVRNPRKFSQNVALTGFKTHKFKAALEAISLIHGLFSDKMEESTEILPWTPDMSEGLTMVQVTNRYFTPTSVTSIGGLLPFDEMIDPRGILAALQSNGYRYTAENEVGYFERVKTEDDLRFQYVPDLHLFCSGNHTLQILGYQPTHVCGG